MKLTFKPNHHPGEDVFENYAFDRLSEREAAHFEEHLLVCESCQSKFAEADEYIQVMKAATAAYVTEHNGSPPSRPRERGLRWNAAAAAILLLTCLTALLSWRTPSAEPRVVTLNAYRGTVSETPSGRPLDLRIDFKDVPTAPGYRVEIVDATGRRVWFGGPPVRLAKGLPPGVYWVRLSTGGGEPLREFGLRAMRSN
jgi:Putative zinc-finger